MQQRKKQKCEASTTTSNAAPTNPQTHATTSTISTPPEKKQKTNSIILHVYEKEHDSNNMRKVLELEVDAGITIATAFNEIAHALRLPKRDIRLRDRTLPCEDPRGGVTAYEWSEENQERLYNHQYVWLQKRLRGG